MLTTRERFSLLKQMSQKQGQNILISNIIMLERRLRMGQSNCFMFPLMNSKLIS